MASEKVFKEFSVTRWVPPFGNMYNLTNTVFFLALTMRDYE